MIQINEEYAIDIFFVDVPVLGYQKKIYACIPKTTTECPVLYMHDGHNLFFKEDSFNGNTWQAEKALINLYEKTGKRLAIIGIGADDRRFDEYSPWKGIVQNHCRGGNGDAYIDWLSHSLIPIIKQKYQLYGPLYMAGSSMGGYISMYAGFKYNYLFEKIGVFSPSFWFNFPEMEQFVKDHFAPSLGIYLDVGKKESNDFDRIDFSKIYLKDAREFRDILSSLGIKNMIYLEDDEGRHSEKDWARRFPFFLTWLFQ